MLSTFAGIDYGSKTSGHTVICYHDGQAVHFFDADKKDADLFILQWVTRYTLIKAIFLDAPLSLPAVYHSVKGFSNYHYRQCDIALKAMSPLFLGGLTARAMALKQRLEEAAKIETYEVYPKALAGGLLADKYHKKLTALDREQLCRRLATMIPHLMFAQLPKNQHQFDALLAWISGYRFMTSQHQMYGDVREGIIIV